MSEDQNSGDDAGEAIDTVGAVAEGLGKAANAVSEAQDGDVAGALGSGLGAAGSATGLVEGAVGEQASEAREALNTASSIAKAGSSAVSAGRGLVNSAQSGSVGQAASGLTSATDASRYVVPDHEAQQVLDGVGQGAGAVGSAAGAMDQMGGGFAGGGSRNPVSYHLEVEGLDGPLEVRQVHLAEGLNQVSACSVTFRCHEHPQARELFRKECSLTIERTTQARSYKGIVRHARIAEDEGGIAITLRIVPALWYLSQIVTSRIHQHTTVPDLVSSLVSELLGGQQRSVRDDTTATYKEHEYLVQYQESYFDFLNRLCEQEGIFWFFDHEEDKEVMVLVDSVSGLPDARDGDDNQVQFVHLAGHGDDLDVVHAVDYDEHVGPTDVALSGFDWTRPAVPMGDEQTGRSDAEPALEIYDHTDALTYHDYQEPAYQADTASAQAQIRAELLDLARQNWSMEATFVGARPGHVFELVNCTDGDLDGTYLIVSAVSGGSARGAGTGSYSTSLKCVPTSVPYRPERRTPRPVVAGFESATVVTDGREIQTDVHGRVKVQFHWDRLGEDDDRSSCWIRVVHNWAGEGFGTFFLPRRGMEVVVGFLGGNPDQPIITGCIYNGSNPVPAELDGKRTQSVIRTKSSENSDGFNELRFEDEAGSEFIYTHAQKDYNEEVEHNHSTHVKVDQTNTVDHDHTETVGNDQKLHVKKNRTKNVDENEKTEIGGNRTEEVTGHEQIHIHQWRKVKVEEDEKLVVHGNRKMVVHGRDDEEIVDGRETIVSTFDNLKVIAGANRNETISGQRNQWVTKKYTLVQADTEKFILDGQGYWESADKIRMVTGPAQIQLKHGGDIAVTAPSSLTIEAGGAKFEMRSGKIKLEAQEIQLKAGESALKLESSKATLKGAMVDLLADMFATIKGTLVRIN